MTMFSMISGIEKDNGLVLIAAHALDLVFASYNYWKDAQVSDSKR